MNRQPTVPKTVGFFVWLAALSRSPATRIVEFNQQILSDRIVVFASVADELVHPEVCLLKVGIRYGNREIVVSILSIFDKNLTHFVPGQLTIGHRRGLFKN